MSHMDNTTITAIERGDLIGERPRAAGCNARLGEHGKQVRLPVLRVTTEDGSRGFGLATADEPAAARLVGRPLNELFSLQSGSTEDGLPIDFALWDLVGKRVGRPVYRLAAAMVDKHASTLLRVPCYDTSLYFDDLDLVDHTAAAERIAAEAQEGHNRGHRNFKIKVGRGARHMPLEEGTARDIAVVCAVRAAVGPDAVLMIDANNGYNLNLTRRVLAETADCNLFWLEEAFHEDPELYRALQAWLKEQGLSTLIADGEGQASPSLVEWARDGLVNVVQYDIFSYGFTPWLTLGRELDRWTIGAAPHHYGRHLGNYVAGHLAAAIDGFTFVEWDEASTPGIDSSGYRVEDGEVLIPDTPGFGLVLDEDIFQQAVDNGGYRVE